MKALSGIRLAFLLLLFFWVCMIFSFSLQSGPSSHHQSGLIKKEILAFVQKYDIKINRNIYAIYQPFMLKGEKVNGEAFVRKTAHVTEYFLLGCICMALYSVSRDKQNKLKWPYFIAGPAIAFVDEKIIQEFLVNHRTSSYKDMLLDSLAFYLAVAVICGARMVYQARKGQPVKLTGKT